MDVTYQIVTTERVLTVEVGQALPEMQRGERVMAVKRTFQGHPGRDEKRWLLTHVMPSMRSGSVPT